MKLATLKSRGLETAAILHEGRLYCLRDVNAKFGFTYPLGLLEILDSGQLSELVGWYENTGMQALNALENVAIEEDGAIFAPLYRRPRKIWGIGLNYREHASDLAEHSPTVEPASFMKPDTSVIGHGDTIELPRMSQKTTGEAELGLVFGRQCKNVPQSEWRSVLAGFTTIIDMTAEDILRRNPRNLTQCKSFDTFFSFGPILYTVDEISDVSQLRVSTVINHTVHATNLVANMTFAPDFLVSYHSCIMTMLPGDIISSGTPGAAELKHGDVVECHIEGFKPLVNKVIDHKVVKAK